MGQVANRVPAPGFELSVPSLAGWRQVFLPRKQQSRFEAALFLSIVAHVLVVLLIGVRGPANKLDAAHTPLIVDLVNARTAAAPSKPDILAQANLDGGGNTDSERRVKSPLPMLKRNQTQPDLALRTRRAEAREPEPQPVMTQSQEPAPAVQPAQPHPRSDARPEPAVPSASDLLNSSRELVQLEAQVSRSMEAYQKRPRRQFIGARAREFRFARYIEDWRSKIERVGELNYPAAARGVYGTMLVSVEIRADGSLENVEISRSSGKKILDEAAVRIVRLAAPFAPFPPDIARDTDILSITRTWSFTLADQFQAE